MQAEQPRLRPMNLGDILDAVFQLYRNNFLIFIGIVALIQVPLIIIQVLLTLAFNQKVATDLMGLIHMLPSFNFERDSIADLPLGNLMAFMGLSMLFALLEFAVAQQLINGALANAVSQRYFKRPVSLLGAYGFGMRRIIMLSLAGFIIAFVLAIVFVLSFAFLFGLVAFIVGFAATQHETSSIIGSVLAMILFVVGMLIIGATMVFLTLCVLFVPQAIVLEHKNAFGALFRSWEIVFRSFWRVLGIFILLYVMVQVITLIPSATLGGIVGMIYSDPIQDFAIRQSLSMLIGYGVRIFVLPFLLIAYTLLYYDIRVRKEGYDLQLMIQEQDNMQDNANDGSFTHAGMYAGDESRAEDRREWE